MSRPRHSELAPTSPEVMLRKASSAPSAGLRAKYAQRGLDNGRSIDRTTRAMLLRQLYLSHMEAKRFEAALAIAEQMLSLGVMPDVARQDAARACLGLGYRRRAVEHLRLAGRVSPPSRRAFHLWSLGSVLYLQGASQAAVGALGRAARWGTTDKPLYLAQLALARIAAGEQVDRLVELRDALTQAPCGQGYGQFVLGELAYQMGDFESARRYLNGFIKRSTGGRIALQVALEGELGRAREVLSKIPKKGQRWDD